MRQPLFIHGRRAATAPPPSPNPDRIAIEIHWSEEAVTTMKIRRHYLEMAKAVCSIRLRPGYREGNVAPFAPAAEAPLAFAPQAGGGAA